MADGDPGRSSDGRGPMSLLAAPWRWGSHRPLEKLSAAARSAASRPSPTITSRAGGQAMRSVGGDHSVVEDPDNLGYALVKGNKAWPDSVPDRPHPSVPGSRTGLA
jgi:hypothetical protein